MNKKSLFFLFLSAYALFALSLLTLHTWGGNWWLVPLFGVAGMIAVVLLAESRADEVVGRVALHAYRLGFWALVMLLLAEAFAGAFGQGLNVPFVWSLGLATWVIVYSVGLWRLR